MTNYLFISNLLLLSYALTSSMTSAMDQAVLRRRKLNIARAKATGYVTAIPLVAAASIKYAHDCTQTAISGIENSGGVISFTLNACCGATCLTAAFFYTRYCIGQVMKHRNEEKKKQ